MTYLVYVAGVGFAGINFLFMRDLRIYARTGLKGYRSAAVKGVIYSALALFGLILTISGSEMIGLGLILAALYLQGRASREKIWTDESRLERLLGKCRWKKDKGEK